MPSTRLSNGDLSFAQTAPRDLAHRRAISEVFVTDSAPVAEDEFVAALQVPRAHGLWNDRRHSFHDPLLAVEACRQATFVGIHRYLGVPIGTPGSLQRVEFCVGDLDAYRDDRANPLEAIVHIRVSDRQERGGELVETRFDGELTIGDRVAMSMGGTILFIPAEDYAILRAHQRARKPLLAAPPPPPPGLDPALVGRYDPRNVAIGDVAPGALTSGEQRFPVLVDPYNPSFFDHAQDHLPGPLIVEVYRQAAIRAATRAGALAAPLAVVTRCQATFTDFAEYEGPTECVAVLGPATAQHRIPVSVRLCQFGAQLAEAEIELTALSES
jgi:A-factor biosynthesis hotdog domain